MVTGLQLQDGCCECKLHDVSSQHRQGHALNFWVFLWVFFVGGFFATD